MRKAFKYKLYPTRQQEAAMLTMLETHRRLYNRALAERKDAWEQERRSVSYVDQSAQLKIERTTNPYLALTNFSSCQATLRRLDKAFQAFFRRVKAGETAGYPRFKGRNRFATVDFPGYRNGCKLDGDRMYFQHVGRVRIKLHRPIEGTIKTVSFTRQADGWHVVFSCDLGDVHAAPHPGPLAGLDLGLKAFLVTSDGESIKPPKFYRKAEKALRRAQRRVSRRQKGSKRRAKAVQILAKAHLHITNQRRDFHHKTARKLVTQYGAIAHEELNIKGIARTRLAKSTYDVGWGQFLNILHSKAEEAGCVVIPVPAKNTTQACSACEALPETPKTLKDRVHRCTNCGYEADRDLNAALNIKRLGSSRQALTSSVDAVV
ncbi:MAG: transposase [Chloroflexi bacterium]|nr:transposase [Chloroflexota bacterium]